MKKPLLIALVSIVSLVAFAGTPVLPPIVVPSVPSSLPITVDLAGSWTSQPATAALANSHGFGAGVGLAYWFMPTVAIRANAAFASLSPSSAAISADVVTRLPNSTSLTPYAFAGAGLATLGSPAGLYRVGGGVEYTINTITSIYAESSYNKANTSPTGTQPVQVFFGFRFKL